MIKRHLIVVICNVLLLTTVGCTTAINNDAKQDKTSCTPAATKCSGATLQTCRVDGSGFDSTKCESGCSESSETAGCLVCQSGSARCSADGERLEVCASNRVTYTSTTCQFGCNASQSVAACSETCRPGTKTCDDKTLKTCNSDGTSFSEETCKQTCSEKSGMCDPVCIFGATLCKNDTLKSCNTSETGYDDEQCANGCLTENGKSACRTCTPNQQRCYDDDTLQICSDGGSRWVPFTCRLGCEASSSTCIPENLCKWEISHFPLTTSNFDQDPAKYVFDKECVVGTQTVNADPSVLLFPSALEGVRVTGRFMVKAPASSGDDDLIGFVFGWQNSRQFYVFDWKKNGQNHPQLKQCGTAAKGMSLRKFDISGDSASANCRDYWHLGGTSDVTILSKAANNAVGWSFAVQYRFTLIHTNDTITIVVRKDGEDAPLGTISVTDSSYPSGRFGFYNYSQQDVRYDGFSFATITEQID